MPFNWARVLLLRLLLGYRIEFSCKIGFLNLIVASECVLEESAIGSLNVLVSRSIKMRRSRVGNMNRFKFLDALEMRANSWIKNRNSVVGTLDPTDCGTRKNQFTIGEDSLITHSHYLDLTAGVSIGDNVVIGGQSSQVWSHGFDYTRKLIARPVAIGSNIYVGSNAIIIQGVSICDCVTIGAGTVVSRPIVEPGFYVSSHLHLKKQNA